MLMCLAACTAGGEAAEHSAVADVGRASKTEVADVARADSAVLRAAETALAAWLTASRESNATSDALPPAADAACGESGAPSFPSMLLADFTLHPFELREGTIVGRAEVVTVAEQDVDRRATDRFVARERVARAVLEWDLVPDDDGGWAVCNGLRFGYRGSDSLTTWRPEGRSYQSARKLADSIVSVRTTARSLSQTP